MHLRRDDFRSTLARFGTEFSDRLQFCSAFTDAHEHLLALVVKLILGTTRRNDKAAIRIELKTQPLVITHYSWLRAFNLDDITTQHPCVNPYC